jgi:hypothetical protein
MRPPSDSLGTALIPLRPRQRLGLTPALFACRRSFAIRHYLWPEEDLMTITKQDNVLTRLTEAFPQAFVLEPYQPHRPLKVGIFSEIAARCPDLARSDLTTVLNIYPRRMMYLQSLVASAARVDLDGTPCGEVTAAAQEHAAARLTEIHRGSGWDADRETGSSCGSGVGDEGADTEGKAGAASTGNQSVASPLRPCQTLACSRA